MKMSEINKPWCQSRPRPAPPRGFLQGARGVLSTSALQLLARSFGHEGPALIQTQGALPRNLLCGNTSICKPEGSGLSHLTPRAQEKGAPGTSLFLSQTI